MNSTPGRTAIHHYVLVAVEYAAGELDAALAEHEAGLALAEGSEERWWDLSFGLAAAVMVHRGELDRASELVKQAEEDLAADGPSPRDDEAARARYLLARSRGDPEGAALAAGEAWGRCADHGYRPHLTWFGVDLVRASLEVGDLQRARDVAETAEKVAKAVPVACWKPAPPGRRAWSRATPAGCWRPCGACGPAPGGFTWRSAWRTPPWPWPGPGRRATPAPWLSRRWTCSPPWTQSPMLPA